MLLTVTFIFFLLHVLAWLLLPASAPNSHHELVAEEVREIDTGETVAA